MAHFSTHLAPLERLPLKAFQFDLSLVGFLPRLAFRASRPLPIPALLVQHTSVLPLRSPPTLLPHFLLHFHPNHTNARCLHLLLQVRLLVFFCDEPRGPGRSLALFLNHFFGRLTLSQTLQQVVPVPRRKLNLRCNRLATLDCMISMRLLAFLTYH